MAKKTKVNPFEDVDYLDDLVLPDTEKPQAPKGWPVASVITAEELVWNHTTQNGRRDLLEMLDFVFQDSLKCRDEAEQVLSNIIGERFGHPVKVLWTFLEFVQRKKHPPLEWQAACWNEMLHQCGYKVPKTARVDPGLETS